MQDARARNDPHEPFERQLGGLEEQRRQRNEHDQRQPKQRRSERDPEARDHAVRPPKNARPAHLVAPRSLAVYAVEHAAVVEMLALRLSPPAENLVDRKQIHLRELVRERLCNLAIAQTVEVARGDLLAPHAVEKPEIILRDGAGSLAVHHFIHHRDRRLGQDGDGWDDDLELVLAELVEREQRLALPGNKNVADVALDEGYGRA